MSRPAKALYIREFINLPGYHSGGHIIVDIDKYGEGILKIADCDRVVTISIDSRRYSPDGNYEENTLFKLKTLHSVIGKAIRHCKRAYGD